MRWQLSRWLSLLCILTDLISVSARLSHYQNHSSKLSPERLNAVETHPNWKLFDLNNCGISNMERIVGGTTASLGQYPWLGRIGYQLLRNLKKMEFRCASALITEFYVLTAGHCVVNVQTTGLKPAIVRLGEFNVDTNPDCDEYGQCAPEVSDYNIKYFIEHENYDRPLYRNDIALIRLDRRVTFGEFVQPICMINGEMLTKNFVGGIAEVAGWGFDNIGKETTSKTLQVLKMPIVDLSLCKRGFQFSVQVGETQLCVGGVVGKDSCNGDSGAPLMKIEAPGFSAPRYYVIGIVSFGAKDCAVYDLPGVYTDLSAYVGWVLDHMHP